VAGWDTLSIRNVFESKGFLIQQWDKVQTDLLTIIPSNNNVVVVEPEGVVATE
jgi:hypothetical protein